MGFSQCNYTDSRKPTLETPPKSQLAHLRSLSKVSNFDVVVDDDDDDDYCAKNSFGELRFKSLLTKMVWEFGLGCFVGEKQRTIKGKNGTNKSNPEHNKAWLLAESGGDLANGEPHSVHSSFRFSICSQVELDSLKTNFFAPSTTILMVNLDNNSSDPCSNELRWRRIESLEKSISPVSSSLIRFSYDEIVAATRNFSQGICIVSFCLPIFSVFWLLFVLIP